MKKGIIVLICLILATLVPFASVTTVLASTDGQYADTYYAALAKQYDRLCSIDTPKVVVVGGSNVAFGLDSKLFEELYGMPSVAFGLYGSLGVKVMLDLSKANLNKGDIVVIVPEVSADSYSLYFGAEAVLKATEGRLDILSHIAFDNYGDCLAASWGLADTKLNNSRTNVEFTLDDVYKNSAVNEYGEIDAELFPRTGNILATGYLQDTVDYNTEEISDDFLDYVNDYVAYCKFLGVEVYFSFTPVNERAVNYETLKEDTSAFYEYLAERLDCEVISNPMDYVFDYRYFYDTNFHLNDSGVVLRTAQLVRDLKLVKDDTSAIVVDIPEPPAAIYQQRDIDLTLPYTDENLFIYEEVSGGFLSIVGVTSGASELTSIVIPVVHDNKFVISIKAYAFENLTALEEVTVPVGISDIDNSVFYGCSSLARIRILERSQDYVAVADGLLNGVPADCKIVIVNATVSDFGTGYFWSRYASYLVKGE